MQEFTHFTSACQCMKENEQLAVIYHHVNFDRGKNVVQLVQNLPPKKIALI